MSMHSRKHWWLHGLKFAVVALVAIGVAGAVVMALWNWLAPALFGGHFIDFWQALGLLVLSRVLFGGWRGGHGRHWRARMAQRWDAMSDEERERFREGMRARCGARPIERTPGDQPS